MKIEYRKLPTEQINFRSRFLDEISVRQILVIMNRENLEIPKAIRPELGRIENAVQKIVKSLKSGGRLYFTGSGTSGRLGVLESAELPPTFNTPPVLAQAIMAGGKRAVFRSREGAEDDRVAAQSQIRKKVRENDVVIGIAASGVTPFVQGALLEARAKKAGTILITCNPGKELKSLADIVIAPHAGPELIAGSTRLKSGTATKMVLNMLTTASMVQLGKVYQNTMVDLQPKSKKLRERGIRLVQEFALLPRKQAVRALESSRWNVKIAILMARKNLSHTQAVQELKKNEGFLKRCL